jgi:hypothetical protein
MGQAGARNSMFERPWIKDSQHFPVKLRDFWGVGEANSHQMHDSVAGPETRPRPERSNKPDAVVPGMQDHRHASLTLGRVSQSDVRHRAIR